MSYGHTPELIPSVTPEDFARGVERVGWERARDFLGISDKTLELWMRGVGLPLPRNQERIHRFMTAVRSGKRLYRVRG